MTYSIRTLLPSESESAAYLGMQFSKRSQNLWGFDLDIAVRNYSSLMESGIITGIGLFKNDNIVGLLLAAKVPSLYNRHLMAQELVWYVDEAHRGKGVLLVKAYLAWAKKEGCTIATMAHMSDSMPEKLKLFYKKLGFSENEIHYAKEL